MGSSTNPAVAAAKSACSTTTTPGTAVTAAAPATLSATPTAAAVVKAATTDLQFSAAVAESSFSERPQNNEVSATAHEGCEPIPRTRGRRCCGWLFGQQRVNVAVV